VVYALGELSPVLSATHFPYRVDSSLEPGHVLVRAGNEGKDQVVAGALLQGGAELAEASSIRGTVQQAMIRMARSSAASPLLGMV
jgi:hypothetical protein